MAIENRGPELQVILSILLVIAVVVVALRCYIRIWLVKSFGIDDWFMVVALTSFSLCAACGIISAQYGIGRHYWDLTPENQEQAIKLWWFCYLWYLITMTVSRISIGYFLLRITVKRLDIWIIYINMILTVLTGIVFFFVAMLQCQPVSFFWDKSQPGSCINIDAFIALTYIYSGFNVICDFTFSILPGVMVWHLNMDRHSKIALIPILAIAGVASSAVVIRLPSIKDFRSRDFFWKTLEIAIWSATEQSLAITAGSLATLRPLFHIILSRLGLSTSKSRSERIRIAQQRAHLEDGIQVQRVETARDQPIRLNFGALLEPFECRSSIVDEEYAEVGHNTRGDVINVQSKTTWRVRRMDNESEEELTTRNGHLRAGDHHSSTESIDIATTHQQV